MIKKEKMFSKVVMLVFLILVVIGFSVPLFNLGGNQAQTPENSEPRLCQSDADCYLMCDDKPVEVLCLQNLCQQNSCVEFNPFPYQSDPVTFSLNVLVDTRELALASNPSDLFVQFVSGDVQIFNSRLPLAAVLEKGGVQYTGQCLGINGTQYCTDAQNRVELWVNGNQSFSSGSYIPKQGDRIELKYISLS